MRTFDYLKNFVSFTASIDDTEIYKPKNIVNFHLSIQADMTAAASISPEATLGLIDPFELKVSAIPRIRLTGRELYVLNKLFLDKDPVMMRAGAATDDKTRILDMLIPMNYSTAAPPLHYSVTRTAVSGVDTEKLTLVAEYSEAALAERPLQLLKYTYIPSATGTMLKALERVLAGELEAILFRSTTVPTDAADTSSVDQIELYVGGDLVTRTREFAIYKPAFHIENADGTPTARQVDNYMLIDFRPEPIPAGSAIRVDMSSDDTNPVHIIPIERMPVA